MKGGHSFLPFFFGARTVFNFADFGMYVALLLVGFFPYCVRCVVCSIIRVWAPRWKGRPCLCLPVKSALVLCLHTPGDEEVLRRGLRAASRELGLEELEERGISYSRESRGINVLIAAL